MINFLSFVSPSQTHPGANLDSTTFLNASLNPWKSVNPLLIASDKSPDGSFCSPLPRMLKKNKRLKAPPNAILSFPSLNPAVS